MASPSVLPAMGDWKQWTPHPAIQQLPYLVAVFLVVVLTFAFYSSQYAYLKDIPLVNPAKSFFFSNAEAKRVFMHSSKQIMAMAKKLYPNRPYRILTDWGEVVILPPKFANEIRNEPKLSFGIAAQQDNHANIPGFETVKLVGRTDQLIQLVARKQLTKHLSLVIEPLSKETTLALSINFGESTGWHEVQLKPAILNIIARLSSRIYLGEQLCRNEDWLRITATYTTVFFTASTKLRIIPKLLRPLAHWFIPECQKLRAEFYKSRHIIEPLIQRRRKLRQEALAAGQPVPEFNDALDWAEHEAALQGATFDSAVFQLTLSLLAIHTTYDLLEQCMIDLAQNPEFIEPLREEVVHVLRADGWKKTSLYNMKLLDSAIKESQRQKPGSIASMRRYVTADLKLSNGLILKKGTRLNVDSSRMMDADLHQDPDKYNAYRFFNMRSQPGREHMAQLVATSADHLGFGHGEHSCPGRFFAANEIKVALCHILVKYEWKLAPATETAPDIKGMVAKSSAITRILIRRREKMELNIDSL